MKKVLKALLILSGATALVGVAIVGMLYYKFDQIDILSGRKVDWNADSCRVLTDLPYGKGERNVYDLYLPAKRRSDALMLFIHGGSWMSGSKEDMEWAAHRYVQEGYVTATINYSRLGNDKAAIDGHPEAPSIASMIAEIQMAVQAIKEKCEELDCPLTQMAVGGYSAGGHLAMLYASRHATTSPLPIRFQISWVGPSDFAFLFPTRAGRMEQIWSGNDEESIAKRKEYSQMMYCLTGDTALLDTAYSAALEDSLKRVASPLHNIVAETPPAVLAYGAKDGLVSARHGEAMSQALSAMGIENRLYVFPNSGHELGFDAEYADSVQHTIKDYCKRYFKNHQK